ncbi:cytochrome P450 [Mycena vulgaris]|nr:cytochrome P450 [Mycena vulgaris]
MSSSPLQTAGLALIAGVLLVIFRSYRARKPLLPPGPRELPLVGNLFDIPKAQEWLAFIEMSKKYDSDIISLDLMGDTVIVLNSVASTDALLENKSAIYSDRPTFPMLNDLVGFHWHLAWKDHRKVFMQQFQPSEVLLHRPSELEAARVLLQRLVDSPGKFERHLRHMAGMVILSTAYGIDVQPRTTRTSISSKRRCTPLACTGNRGAFLVDSLPFLEYVPDFFPGAGFKKAAREWYNPSLAAGTAKSSIAAQVLGEIEETPDAENREEVLKNILGACYAGADTVRTFILAMTLYPEIQKKAQAAVDEVVDHGRLPDVEDNIPYVDAVVREVLRWWPVLPLSIPHAVTNDDIYNGYHIPAGSVVVGNSWAILHDEATYGPDTASFIPERWLTKDGKINTVMREPDAAFGFGRRICPGKDMAQWSVWICVASILATLNISKSVDDQGKPIEPSGDYTSGLLIYPLPHKCEIMPRSEAAQAMIRTATHT